ncbi:MAG: phosphoribosylglycinamide formyltransferase [Bacteroidota bacterium]
MSKRIAILASGTGSNARKIMEHFQDSTEIEVALVVSNKKEAGVLDIAHEFGVETKVINRAIFQDETAFLAILQAHRVNFIVLAGFLWLIPTYLVAAFPNRIVNIHPALLPKYGGKGMHGSHVHEAVKAAGETETGITIHLVNEHYDEGAILFQARCAVAPEDSAADIARNVLALEHRHFPKVVEKWVLGQL